VKNKKALINLCLVLLSPVIGFSEVVKEYYDSGKLKREENYKNGKLEGSTKSYYERGALKTEIYYKNGKAEGFAKTYFESGETYCIDTYKDDQQIKRKIYDIKGKLEYEQDFPYIEKK
jgi:antitoxin component YwqK of YwqJK toxin-antitoxin module